MRGISTANLDIGLARAMFKVMSDHYPERYGTEWWVGSFWVAAGVFVRVDRHASHEDIWNAH